jgi:predicted transcriptional regulator
LFPWYRLLLLAHGPSYAFLIHKPYIVRLLIGKGVLLMRRSKLEMYVDILKVLAQRGPLKLTHVMYKANVNCSLLKEYLDFLIKQGLVEERTVGKQRVVYAATQRGVIVLKYFRELRQALSIVEEARNGMLAPY